MALKLASIEKNIPQLAPLLSRSLHSSIDQDTAIEIRDAFVAAGCPTYFVSLYHLTKVKNQSIESFIQKMRNFQQIASPSNDKIQELDPTLKLMTTPATRQKTSIAADISETSLPKPHPVLAKVQPPTNRESRVPSIGLFGFLAIGIACAFGYKKLIQPHRQPASMQQPAAPKGPAAQPQKTQSLLYKKNVNNNLQPGQTEEPPPGTPKWSDISAKPEVIGTVFISRTLDYERIDSQHPRQSYQRETIVDVQGNHHRSIIEHINEKGAKLGLPDTQTEFATGDSPFRSKYVDSPDWGSVEVTSLGTFSQLFPLQIGRAVRFDANVQYTKFNGKYVLKKYCKVIGQEAVEIALGKFNTVRIDCFDTETDIPADQFFYAPTLSSFVKSKRFRRAVGTNVGVSATVWELVSKTTAVGNK